MSDFVGFNTVGTIFPPFTLTDVNLVKRDLLNELTTRKGERVMNPNFGTIIYDLVMEPSDDETKEQIEEDAVRIVKKDPRVRIESVLMKDYTTFIALTITISYVPQSLTETLYVTYNRNIESNYQ